MTNTNVSSRFDGHHTTGEEGTQPMQSGVLPEDFGQRLERLKEASGLSWRGMAKALGVDPKQLLRWRKGVEPCGGAMHSIFRFASPVARRPGDPHRRGLPDDLLQGLTGTPRRAYAQRRQGGASDGTEAAGARPFRRRRAAQPHTCNERPAAHEPPLRLQA